MRGGRSAKQKGDRVERKLIEEGRSVSSTLRFQRVPMSGSSGGEFSGDIEIHGDGLGKVVVEAKGRSNGFKLLYEWLEDRDILVVVSDRRESLAVLPWKKLVDLLSMVDDYLTPGKEEQKEVHSASQDWRDYLDRLEYSGNTP